MRLHDPIRFKSLFLTLLTFSALVVGYLNISLLIQPPLNVYYHYVNPKAYARVLEIQYKEHFDKAEHARLQANFTSTEMTTKASDAASLFSYQEKIRSYFKQREEAFQAMVDLDREALQLWLPQDYKDFYAKRLEADTNDFQAFTAYRTGYEKLFKPAVTLTKFFKLRADAGVLIHKLYDQEDMSGYTQENFEKLIESAKNLSLFYELEIGSKSAELAFPEELVTALKYDSENIQLSSDVMEAYALGDEQRGELYGQALIALNNQKYIDPYEIFHEWASKITSAADLKQGEAHNASYYLYNQAYSYAQEKNLPLDLNKVWGESYPGTGEIEPSIIDFAINDEKSPEFLKEFLRGYTASYSDPAVKHIREALNAALNNSENWPQLMSREAWDSLQSYDKSYYKSKFIVVFIVDAEDKKLPTRLVYILFVDSPDTQFKTLVENDNGKYRLVSFTEERLSASQATLLREMEWLTFGDKKYRM